MDIRALLISIVLPLIVLSYRPNECPKAYRLELVLLVLIMPKITAPNDRPSKNRGIGALKIGLGGTPINENTALLIAKNISIPVVRNERVR